MMPVAFYRKKGRLQWRRPVRKRKSMEEEMKASLKVLIVENNPVDRKMLCGMLSKSSYGSFTIEATDNLAEAFDHLTRDEFNVILLDLNLQDSSGLDTLKKMHQKFPHVPIVVNTGAYEDTLGLKAVTRGAQDYLIKGKYKSYGLSKSLYYAVERKKAEEELKEAYESLKTMQAQLIQVEKMKVVGTLASGIAHEVKNPLATILYGVEFLQTKCQNAAADDQINLTIHSIKDAARKANEIIKDLLDFASLSVLKCKPENINTVLEESLSLVRHQCDKSSIMVVKDYAEDLPDVNIDKNRIEQVIVDLLINSILAMPTSGTIIVKTFLTKLADVHAKWAQEQKVRLKAEQLVVVHIEDNGYGIKPDDMSKIFDPFFTTRRAAGGVGLGLSVARTIMNNHGGLINVENKKEGGARAELYFKA